MFIVESSGSRGCITSPAALLGPSLWRVVPNKLSDVFWGCDHTLSHTVFSSSTSLSGVVCLSRVSCALSPLSCSSAVVFDLAARANFNLHREPDCHSLELFRNCDVFNFAIELWSCLCYFLLNTAVSFLISRPHWRLVLSGKRGQTLS